MANYKTIITLCDENFNSCGDIGVNIQDLLTTELTTITTINGFDNVLYSELIDVKSRKTISAYPTLRLLYERYRDGFQSNVKSSAFDYYKMDNFVSLVGNYWVDLIEQVVPSTTIWGSTIKYRNTIFDNDKFKYKQYSLFTCVGHDGIQYPSPTSGYASNVEVIISDIGIPTYVGPECLAPTNDITICSGVTIQQINYGSEFIGSVTIMGDITLPNPTGTTGDNPINIGECDLIINNLNIKFIDGGGANITPSYVGGTAPYTFNWIITHQTGQFSAWNFQNGVNTNNIATLSGTTTGPFGDGDRLCLSLQMYDTNNCTYGLSVCYPQ